MQRALVALALAAAVFTMFSPAGWCVLPNQEKAYKDLHAKEKAVWTFSPGEMTFAAAMLDYGNYGEFRIYGKIGKAIQLMVKGKMKKEQIRDSSCFFVFGGAHAVVTLREPFEDTNLTAMLVFNLVSPDANVPVFSIQPVYDMHYEVASTDQLILWQKDSAFYNRSTPPYKYNYFLLTYDSAINRYTFDFLLRGLIAPGADVDEGVILNNLAVQSYRVGDLKTAAKKLEDAMLVANLGRGVIMDNRRYVQHEQDALATRQQASLDQPATAFDDLKMSFLQGEYNLVLMSMQQGGAQSRRGDRIALYGLSYAHNRDYAGLQRITKLLKDAKYENFTDYLGEVSRVLFFNRDLDLLKAYLKSLESEDPKNPTLAYLKAAVLADSGRTELATQYLLNYLSKSALEERYLGECREYLYELASSVGDLDTAGKALARLTTETVWDMRNAAFLINFNGILHTDLIKPQGAMGSRLKAPKNPLDTLGFQEGVEGNPSGDNG
jgi:hypothetical protein